MSDSAKSRKNLAQFKRPVHANLTSKIVFGSKHFNIQKANH